MYILMYKGDHGCSAMGIFFSKKKAKKARDSLIAYDVKKYPKYHWRNQRAKAQYSVMHVELFKTYKHEDPYEV